VLINGGCVEMSIGQEEDGWNGGLQMVNDDETICALFGSGTNS